MSRYSDNTLRSFERYNYALDDAWSILTEIQALEGVAVFLENPLQSKEELYQNYLEYLWLLERLHHPQEKAFYKSHFLPINGYFEAFINLQADSFNLFQAEYLANPIGEMDWQAIKLVRDAEELEQILAPGFDFPRHYSERRGEYISLDFEKIAQKFFKNLRAGTLAEAITLSNLQFEDKPLKLKAGFRSLTIYPVTGMAHVFLPEAEHQLEVYSYWCERLEDIYLFEIYEHQLLPMFSNLNALSYTNRFLGSHSAKAYQGVWHSKEFGSVSFSYKDERMRFTGLNTVQKTVIKECYRKLTES